MTMLTFFFNFLFLGSEELFEIFPTQNRVELQLHSCRVVELQVGSLLLYFDCLFIFIIQTYMSLILSEELVLYER